MLRERDEGFIQISQMNSSIRKKNLKFEEKLAAVWQRPVLHNLVDRGGNNRGESSRNAAMAR